MCLRFINKQAHQSPTISTECIKMRVYCSPKDGNLSLCHHPQYPQYWDPGWDLWSLSRPQRESQSWGAVYCLGGRTEQRRPRRLTGRRVRAVRAVYTQLKSIQITVNLPSTSITNLRNLALSCGWIVSI